MKFVCPVCKTAGDIAEDESGQPAEQATCQKCGTALSIERGTGQVRTTAADKRPPAPRPKDEMSSVLSLSSQDKGKKDYTALGVFAVVLTLLIGAGVYFTLNMDRGVLNQPLNKLSKLVEDVSRYGKAIFDEFQKSREPKSQETRLAKKHMRKGYDHYKANRQKKAIEELSQALEIDPQNAEAYFWRARAFIRMGQFDNAIADLNEVVELNPRYSPAYDNLGWLLLRRNKYDESLIQLNKSIELKPDNGWTHYMRSRIYFKKGNLKNALENAKSACKLGYKDACRDAKSYESQLAEKG
jgi:tetratricopeptide (TPR) repeat protein